MKTVKYDEVSSERTFMSGVIVLSVSTVIVKIIGLAYKIPLMSILGAEGMGYFNTAYEIFALLCGVSTSGLPIAVSMLVSSSREMGNTAKTRGLFKTSSALLLTKGVVFSGILAVFAEPIARLVGNHQAYFAILAISPALLFCCASGAIRGYFQGYRMMTPTAISQLIEAIAKLLLGVLFAYLAVRVGFGMPTAAAFAVLGVSVGSFISSVYLFIRKKIYNNEIKYIKKRQGVDGEKTSKYFFELLRISLPITMCSALIGVTRIIDMTLIMRRLGDIGISTTKANEIYGSYTTLALPIFSLVPAFIPPITESLIPRLSAAVESGSKREQSRAVSNAARLTIFLAMPASMGISLYSKQIITLLFAGETEAIAIASPLLSALGVSVLLSCIITTTNAILQSYRKVMLPIFSLAIGAVAKAASAYFLIGNQKFAELGAPMSTFLSNAVVVCLNLWFVSRAVNGKTGLLSSLPKPFFASVISMLASYAVYMILARGGENLTAAFLVSLGVAIVMYFILAVTMDIVSWDDINIINKKHYK